MELGLPGNIRIGAIGLDRHGQPVVVGAELLRQRDEEAAPAFLIAAVVAVEHFAGDGGARCLAAA